MALLAGGWVPQPAVSSTGTDALIRLNGAMRDAGVAFLVVLAVASVAILVAARVSGRARAMVRTTRSSAVRRSVFEWILPPVIVTAVAVGSALGDETGRGANEPLKVMAAAVQAPGQRTYVVLQHADALPFNHSALSAADVGAVTRWAARAKAPVLPFTLALGDAARPDVATGPSSTAIVAMPQVTMARLFSLDARDVAPGHLTAVVSRQFAQRGDRIRVDGTPARVVGSIDVYPGLDRTVAILPARAASRTVFANDPQTGVLVSTSDGPQPLRRALQERGSSAAVITLGAWSRLYDRFWGRSVKPVQMQFVLMIVLIGMIAGSYIRIADILRRRPTLAVVNVLGVTKRTLRSAEYLATTLRAAVAVLAAAPAVVLLTAVTNSSQYGLKLSPGLSGLGAGALLFTAASFASTLAANTIISRLDSSGELRL